MTRDDRELLAALEREGLRLIVESDHAAMEVVAKEAAFDRAHKDLEGALGRLADISNQMAALTPRIERARRDAGLLTPAALSSEVVH